MISRDDAKAFLPRGLQPYTLFGKGLLQVAALKYRDLKFEGRSLGPCTDVFIAIATKWDGKIHGYTIDFYNNNEEVVRTVNSNWFFEKRLAHIDWRIEKNYFFVSVTSNNNNNNNKNDKVIEYESTIPSRLILLPLLQRTRKALTESEGIIYTFDNVFDKWFGFYMIPKIKVYRNFELLTKHKTRFYSMIWFNDILRINDVKPVAKVAGDLAK